MDPETTFVSGSRASAPIKLLDVEEAVKVVGSGGLASTRDKSISSPKNDDIFDVGSKAEFIALKAADRNSPLKDRPNHMLAKLRTLEVTDCCQSMDAAELAWRMIQIVQAFPNVTADEIEYVEDQKTSLENMMAYLWHIAVGLSRPVPVNDVGDASDALDRFCCKIREELSQNAINVGAGGGGQAPAPINVTVDTTTMNATQQALLLSVNAMTTSLLAVDADKKEKKSILNGMSPSNRDLFTKICTTDIRHVAPKMSDFLKSLLAEKNASHIANHLRAITRNWKGTFIEGAFCRFLAKGYISQRDSMLPGGSRSSCLSPRNVSRLVIATRRTSKCSENSGAKTLEKRH
jgi:hypothetical protein